jgi:lipid A 3-O-deacylase
MMNSLTGCALALVGVLVSTVLGVANAGELRLGIADHDARDIEDGINVQPQFVFDSVGPLARYDLRPYLHSSWNSDGKLLVGGGGILKQWTGRNDWFFEAAVGIVVHDGRIDLPPRDRPGERSRVLRNDNVYGCRALFHLSPAIGRRLDERWIVAAYYEHMSHGQILCSGVNPGLDNFGVRLGRRL